MKPEAYREHTIALNGWQIRLSSYKLGEQFLCTADNVSPGGWLARAKGASRREAEQQALDKARKVLARTHRQAS
jgi:dsRNA-specific ribonuclease